MEEGEDKMPWWGILLIAFGCFTIVTLLFGVYCALILASREDEQMEKYFRHISDTGRVKKDDSDNGSGA